MATELTQEQADTLNTLLVGGASLRENGHWGGVFTPPRDWRQVDLHVVYNKIKTENLGLGLFAKMYAPALVAYSRAIYDASLEVAHLRTTPFVLAPIAIAQTTIFFPRGESMGDYLFEDFFKDGREVVAIRNVADKYGLRVTSIIALIDFPNLGAFATDIFDDSYTWKD